MSSRKILPLTTHVLGLLATARYDDVTPYFTKSVSKSIDFDVRMFKNWQLPTVYNNMQGTVTRIRSQYYVMTSPGTLLRKNSFIFRISV